MAGERVVTESGGQLKTEVEVDKTTTPPPTVPAVNEEFSKLIPAELADREWVKNLAKHENPIAELFKQHENQQVVLGRKTIGLEVPGADAKPEDWQKFHAALAPKAVEDYKYEVQVPDKLKEFYAEDADFLKLMREAAQKAGVTAEGFKELYGAYHKYGMNVLEKSIQDGEAALVKLDADFKAKYGERAPQVVEQWTKLSTLAPDWAQPVLQGLSNEVKVALAAWSESVASKYIREDSIDHNIPNAPAQMTQKQYGEKFGELLATMRKHEIHTPEYMRAERELKDFQEFGRQQVFKQQT